MGKARTTQHRPKEVSEEKENQVLRSKINKLTKTVAKLRRELTKRQSVSTLLEEDEDIKEMPVAKSKAESCPQCTSIHLTKVPLNSKMLTVCKNCGWRQMI